MSAERHGITIALERIDSESVLILKATGGLVHEDYEMITPVLELSLLEIWRLLEVIKTPSIGCWIKCCN